MTLPLVTILDDEAEIRNMLTEVLEEAGFRTQCFARAREFEAALKHVTPDVCLVDLSLPDTDGLALVHRLALERGAAVTGARYAEANQKRLACNGLLAQVFDRYALEDDKGAETPFSHAEGEVLRLFLESPKRLISRAQMQETLGGAAGESFDRAMDVRISRLRTKLREDPKNPRLIKTIYGAGYIFLGDVQWR